MENITNLFFNNIINNDNNDHNYYLMLGYYYEKINPNIDLMYKYYELSANNNNYHAIKKIIDYYINTNQLNKINNYINFLNKNNIEDIALLETYYNKINKPNEIIKIFENTNNPIFYNKLGIYYKNINEKKSIYYFTKDIENNNFYSAIELGNIYRSKINNKKNNYIANMFKYYDLARDNNIYEVYMEYAKYYKSINSINDMIKMYEKAIEHKIYNASYELALHYKSINNIKKYIKLLNLDINNDNSILELSHYYISKNKYSTSLPFIDLGISKNLVNSYYYKGKYCNFQKKYDEMVKFFNMHIEKGGILAFLDLGYYYNNNNNYNLALEQFNKSNDIIKHYYLGNTYFKMNDYENMINSYNNYIVEYEKNPTNDNKHILDTYFDLISYYQNIGNINKVDELYNNLTNKFPVYIMQYIDFINEHKLFNSELFLNMFEKICSSNNSVINNNQNIIKLTYVMNNNLNWTSIVQIAKKYIINNPIFDNFITKYNLTNQVLINKRKLAKEDDCPICFEFTNLIPYDCFGHYFCEACYPKLHECAFCKFKKYTNNNDSYDDESDEELS